MRSSLSNNTVVTPINTCGSARGMTARLRLSTKPSAAGPIVTKRETTFLNTVRGRAQSAKRTEVAPDLAARVVKGYILPMFESDCRRKSDEQRTELYGHKRNFSAERGTVYSELKLSEKLSLEIEKLEGKIEQMEQTVKEGIQEMNMLLKDKEKLEIEVLNAQTNVEAMSQENLRLQREVTGIKLNIGGLSVQLKKYKELYEQVRSENDNLSNLLHEEKAANDIRLYLNIFFNYFT
jgi:intracellular sulfur oxidation DsrE/DsrF family protein